MSSTCRFLKGLFGPQSGSVPVWGHQDTLAQLALALDAGLSISNTTPTTGISEASHAMETAVGWLQKNGKAPYNLQNVSALSDEQRIAHGFEPSTALKDPATSVQNMGIPPFKDLNMAMFLAGLRVAARYQQLTTGVKPVFQVGVVTLTVQGIEQQFFAQTLLAELGEVTDTVWLYRWCITGLYGQYEEHWRAFDGPVGSTPQAHVMPQTVYYDAANSSASSNPSDTASEFASLHQEPKQTRAPKHKCWEHFEHACLSDDELFAGPSELLQGDAILRLAHSYSNQAIFDRINAAHPEGMRIKSVNVITKRLTHAIQLAAQAYGRSVHDIRAQITEAKSQCGVRHRGKVDVTPYG